MAGPIRARFVGGPMDGGERVVSAPLTTIDFLVSQPIHSVVLLTEPVETTRAVYVLASIGEVLATYVYQGTRAGVRGERV